MKANNGTGNNGTGNKGIGNNGKGSAGLGNKDTRRNFLARMAAVCAVAVMSSLRAPIALGKEIATRLARIKGRIIQRSDVNYELWWSSMVWYRFKPRRYPDIIIQAKSEQDIVEALAYASEKKIKVVVRASGHNPAKAVLREGGMLLDLSAFRDVEVDADSQTAWLQPGVSSEEFVLLLAEQGFDFPAAHTGIVGLGGYVLGGGLGWNMPQRGIACRSILAAEVIIADGKKVLVNENQNQDLLWAIRGAGPGFFGIVLRYQVQVYPIHPRITKSKYLFAIDKLPKICDILKDLTKKKEERLEILAVVGRFYPPDKPPEERELVCAISVFAFADSAKDAEKLLQPVTNSALPGMSLLKKENVHLNYSQLYAGQETDHSSPKRTAVTNIWTDDPSAGLQALAKKMLESPPPSPRCFVLSAWGFNPMLEEDKTACVLTPSEHYISWYLMAEEEAHIEANNQWMDESIEMMKPLQTGHYINEIDPLRYPYQVAECFSEKSWKRLAVLRKQYDPDNVFHTYLGHT